MNELILFFTWFHYNSMCRARNRLDNSITFSEVPTSLGLRCARLTAHIAEFLQKSFLHSKRRSPDSRPSNFAAIGNLGLTTLASARRDIFPDRPLVLFGLMPMHRGRRQMRLWLWRWSRDCERNATGCKFSDGPLQRGSFPGGRLRPEHCSQSEWVPARATAVFFNPRAQE